MNTKTTKFLAVLAVLAMAFASVTVVVSSEQNDATTDTVVDGIKITDAGTYVEASVSGNKATYVGLFEAVSDSTWWPSAETADKLFAEVTLAFDAKYTKVVVTDSAYRLAVDNSYETSKYKKTSEGLYQYTATDATEVAGFSIPVPKDASSVVVEMYTGSSSAYVLAKTITLDFSNAFTRIALGAGAMNPDAKSYYSTWSLTAEGTGANTLALKNYSGNEIFSKKDGSHGLNVTVEGDCTLAYVLPDKAALTATANRSNTIETILSAKALSISNAAGKTGSLTILADAGDETTITGTDNGVIGGIRSAETLTVSGLDYLKIDISGEWVPKAISTTQDRSEGAYGILAAGVMTIGDSNAPQYVEISVTPGIECSHGIFAAGGNSVQLYVNGIIESSSAAIVMNGNGSGTDGEGLKITKSGTELLPLVLIGSEKAIQAKNNNDTVKFESSYVSAQIVQAEGYNAGDNFVAGISVQKLESKDSYIYTDGLYFYGTAATLTYTAKTTGDVIEVSGDYVQNPDSKVTPAIAGLWVDLKNASTIDAYTGIPDVTPAVKSYILLDNKAKTYGNVKVMDSKGREAKITYNNLENLTTAGIENTYATEILFKSAGAQSGEKEIEIPVEKTITMDISTTALSGKATDGTVFKCGDVSFKLAAGKGFIGTITINKDGIVIDGATALELTDVVGPVTIKGTIAGTAATSITAKEGKTVDVTFANSEIKANKLTITGAKTVDIPKGVTVTVSKDLEIVKQTSIDSTLTIAGTAAVTSTAATISMGENTALVVESTGKITGDSNTELAVTLANKASADVKGVLGYHENTVTTSGSNAAIGYGTTYITGENITGFKVVYDTTMNVTGSITSANKYYSGAELKVVSSTELTIGKDVVATASALTMTGALVIDGTMVSTAVGNLIIGSDSAAGGSMTVNGKFVNASFTVATETFTNTAETDGAYLYGYTFATEKHGENYFPVISGSLTKYLPKDASDDAKNAKVGITLTNGTLYTKDTFSMGAKTQLIIGSDKTLIGKINAPENNVAIFNVTGGETAGLTITAGSLDISGDLAATTDTTKPSVEIVSGETVTLTSVKNNNATIAIDNGVEAKVKTAMEVGEGNITVKDGALLDFEALTTDNVTAKAGTGALTNLVVEGEVSNSAPAAKNVISKLGLKAGAVYNEDGYFYEVFDSTVTGVAGYTFAVGVKDYKYNGEAQLTDGKILTKITKISGEGDVKFSGTGTLKSQTYMDVKEYVDAFTTDVDIGGTIKTISVSVYITPFEFTVTFDRDGGTIKPTGYPNPLTYQVTDKTTKFKDLKAFPTAIKPEFVFDGWEKAGQADVFLTDDVTIFEASNSFAKTSQKVKAIYTSVTEATYTVSFVENGGSAIDDQEIKYGDKVDETETITTREGFVFDGWYTEEGLINKFNFRSAVTGDITLYAGWIEEDVADTVDIAVSFVGGNVKVTIAGEGDKNVPVGEATVSIYYWKTVGGITFIDEETKTVSIASGKIVNTNTVTPSVTAIYVVVEYESASGAVSMTTPIVFAQS